MSSIWPRGSPTIRGRRRRNGFFIALASVVAVCRSRFIVRTTIAVMEAKVREGHAPAVVVALEPGETLTSEAGAMMFISGDVTRDVEMPGPGHVTLQTLPFSRTARRVLEAARGGGERSGSGLLDNLLGG